MGWLDWSPCSQGLRTRSQFVEEEKVGAGKDCPELQYKEEGKQNYAEMMLVGITNKLFLL